MKIKLLVTLFLLTCLFSSAGDIDVNTAMAVAKNFYARKASANHAMNQAPDLKLAIQGVITAASGSSNAYYIFNINTSDGFIIVSGDDVALPVLGYTEHGSFHADHLPPSFSYWLNGYKEEIQYAKANMSAPAAITAARWEELLSPSSTIDAAATTVNPLLTTTWNQDDYYNTDCPFDITSSLNHHVPTGCVATAMAQIMKYWSFPVQGTGYHGYIHPIYGSLGANFGATTYNWGAMPNAITADNSAIATLMYQCGVSVEMDYGVDGSGAYVISADNDVCSQSAYPDYFGYDPSSIQGVKRDDVGTTVAWKALLKNELDHARPLQYAGFGTGGGHTWVCDGYDASDFFHMNWGWGGAGPDGYYSIDALDPSALGAGGGDGGFTYNHQALIGIKPLSTPTGAVIKLNSVITVAPTPIPVNSAFTVNVDLINKGSANFDGYFYVTLSSLSGQVITFLATHETNGTVLAPNGHYSGGLTFNCSSAGITPGNYILEIDYQSYFGSETAAASNGFTNPVAITIQGAADVIQLSSAITPDPPVFVQDGVVSVTANIKNNDISDYTGIFAAAITTPLGDLVELIDTYVEDVGLPAGESYPQPLTFTTALHSTVPGTYKLGIYRADNIASDFELIGNALFPNPIDISVVAPSLDPDIYESNNTVSTAHTLQLNWSLDAATVKTTGSNIHISGDVDYYRLILPAGYTYIINARAEDDASADDGNTYSANVVWSYRYSGGWSQTFDDVGPGNINITGPDTVVFHVAPYFSGNIGNYLLKAVVIRSEVTGTPSVNDNGSFSVYPNPAIDNINAEIPFTKHLQSVRILNALGQMVLTPSAFKHIDVSALPKGLYSIEAIADGQKYTSTFVIER